MQRVLLLSVLLLFTLEGAAWVKDSTIYYNLPDSVKAVQFMVELKVANAKVHTRLSAGISVYGVDFSFSERKGKRGIYLQMHDVSRLLSLGQGVKKLSHGGAYFDYKWAENKNYKLLIATAFDSASRLTVFSAYIFLPDESKWKFLVCRKHPFFDTYIKEPSSFINTDKKTTGNVIFGQVWVQRQNGSWKNLKEENLPPPTINFFGHVDSVQQRQIDIKQVEDSIASGKTDAIKNEQGVYYTMLKEGTGRQVSIDDTVVIHYKGYLFSDGSVFDQTKDKPATFPLKRLIRGWQIGVPLCKVGGKIKLVIPSDLAYSIRTRAAKIPPNSILVFEIEVLDVKPPL